MTLQTLPVGYTLAGQYVIQSVLGSGGFGITYAARDTSLEHTVAIKEYFPRSLAQRRSDNSVAVADAPDAAAATTQQPREAGGSTLVREPIAGAAGGNGPAMPRPMEVDASTAIRNLPAGRQPAVFEWGRQRFLNEARTLARLKHASIPQVFRVFEANGTAYMALELIEGEPLRAALGRRRTALSQPEVDRLVEPLLDALALLHEAGVLHRDVTPNNIVVRPDGRPVLLDFGSARSAAAERAEPQRNVYTVVTPHFAAPEQYMTGAEDGAFTDIYSMAAVIYLMIARRDVPEATHRLLDDPLQPLATAARGDAYRPEFLRAVDWALQLRPSQRPQSIAQWQAGLFPWKALAQRAALNRTRGSKVFISYRRADSRAEARLVYQHLAGAVGADDVFFDVDSIPYGVDFRTHIRGSIMASAVVVAIIGPRWSASLAAKPWQIWRRRSEDFVRIELELAIEHGVPILPVLVGGTTMPEAAALPRSLAAIRYANAPMLGSGGPAELERIAAAVRQFRD